MSASYLTKPLVRWTVGNVHPAGIEVLYHSICNWRRLYPNKFNLVVCHNSLDAAILKALDVPLLPQDTIGHNLIHSPKNGAWKLVPPRLNPDGHEIFIDNDIVLHRRLTTVDDFLQSSTVTFMTEGLSRRFGQYDNLIPAGYQLNSGLFGIPPSLDFEAEIEKVQHSVPAKWDDFFDEQGMVASILHRQSNFVIIPKKELSICLRQYVPGTHGHHFTRVNIGETAPWEKYKSGKIKLL